MSTPAPLSVALGERQQPGGVIAARAWAAGRPAPRPRGRRPGAPRPRSPASRCRVRAGSRPLGPPPGARSPPACASETRQATARPPSASIARAARSGHSTNVTVLRAEVGVEEAGVLVVEARRGGTGRGGPAARGAPAYRTPMNERRARHVFRHAERPQSAPRTNVVLPASELAGQRARRRRAPSSPASPAPAASVASGALARNVPGGMASQGSLGAVRGDFAPP